MVIVPPKDTDDPLIVTDELVRAELGMLVRVLVDPEMLLLVKVSVVALPTRVSVAAGMVRVPDAAAEACKTVDPEVAPVIFNGVKYLRDIYFRPLAEYYDCIRSCCNVSC
jgi:hypothetical protein